MRFRIYVWFQNNNGSLTSLAAAKDPSVNKAFLNQETTLNRRSGNFFGASRFLLKIWALPKFLTKKTARSIRFSSWRSHVLIPQNLD
ncbi:MAG: hypothetical protein U5L45_22965 [Saprospiraceae bacterium]|nr:hypothetical protein [Saprospiraceae bacterium]